MNKHAITNVVAVLLTVAGFFLSLPWLLSIGLFALSGALTNWLAVHMLFEKVPGLYGSGVIPNQFEQIKEAIKRLFMSQFFTQENINKLMSAELDNSETGIDFTPIIENTDLNPAFDSLVDVIENSQFGAMLGMFGGTAVLEPMKQPFIEKMQSSLIEISSSEVFHNTVQTQLTSNTSAEKLQSKIEAIIEARLEELTPELVKELIQNLIKEHLGWLVVWGGVFGGVFGLLAHFI